MEKAKKKVKFSDFILFGVTIILALIFYLPGTVCADVRFQK